MPDETQAVALKEEVGAMVTWARELKVATKADADAASLTVGQIKAKRRDWCAYWAPIKDAAHTAWKGIVAKEKEGTDIADAAIQTASGKILAWQSAERARVEAEQRRLQAIADEQARKERERVEALARAQREKEEAALRAEAEARAKAQVEQNAARRAELEAEAERHRKEAEKRAAMAAEREEKAEAVPPAPVITLTADKATAGGASISTTWKAELVDLNMLIAAAAGGNSIAATFLSFDGKTACSFARGNMGRTPVPGVRFFEAQSLSNRTAKE